MKPAGRTGPSDTDIPPVPPAPLPYGNPPSLHFCHGCRLGIASSAIDVRFFLCKHRFKILYDNCLRMCFYNLTRPVMQLVGTGISLAHNNRPDHQIKNTIPDISQCQWGIGPDIDIRNLKFFLMYASIPSLMHCAPIRHLRGYL